MNINPVEVPKGNILLVDDTPENLRLLSDLLTNQGYEVRCAINGAMALMGVATDPPDLILLDINMPGMNGYEVCTKLKADRKICNIPVIFLSAYGEALDKVEAFAVGGVDYITKPFQIAEVLVRIENQLTIRQLQTELEKRVEARTSELKAANQALEKEICDRQLAQEQLLYMAWHDTLTGLPNRAFLMKQLDAALQRSKVEPSYQFAVLFLDCDRFKIVNDSLGHLVGDELLVAIASRLESCLNSTMTLARLGGDEFTILQEDIKEIREATYFAEQIHQQLAVPFYIGRREIFINASIGIVESRIGYDRPEHLLRDADTAMYQAKAFGKACYQVFDATMHDRALSLLQLETDLRHAIAISTRRAIEHQEFLVYYQPIVSLTTGLVSGFEALVRWKHPERGLISPAEFIPIAEETGLIIPLGEWVMREACSQLYTWQQLTPLPLTISVNLSVKQFSQPNLIEQIDRIIAQTKLDSSSLKLEITESAIMDNPSAAAAILAQLRSRRIQLSIDDFGTGYSSLSYLHSFPVNTLKIDRSFISRMGGNGERAEIVRTCVMLAHNLGMDAIAEGVETNDQVVQLKALGCDFGQGYFFSKPMNCQLAGETIACIQT